MQTLHNIYVQNIARFPVFYQALADQLGVSVASLRAIEIGLMPCDDYNHWAWTSPERDSKGNVIGITKRYPNGKKLAVAGAERGLTYVKNQAGTDRYANRKWERVSKDYPCTICNKSDGCMYPKGEYENPNAVVCVHVSEGSDRPLSEDAPGFLHILDPARQRSISLLLPSEHPILVVEGASDVCAAFDLGFTAVGRPSAQGGGHGLVELLSGHTCVIMGENDAGAGRRGMESTFNSLREARIACSKVMPPDGVKDLRQWVQAGLTQTELLAYIERTQEATLGPDTFEDNAGPTIAKAWLQTKTVDGKLYFRIFRKGFVEFNSKCYQSVDDLSVRGNIYTFLEGKDCINDKGAAVKYKPSKAKVSDIIDACSAICPIKKPWPTWLDDRDNPNPARLIAFQNGILDINDYINGKITLYDPTPDLFTFNALPYGFDEDLESQLWNDTLLGVVEEDEERVRFFSQWFGYNLVPDMSLEKFLLMKGPPGSGKSTVLHAMTSMLGAGNWAATDFSTLAYQFGFESLIGKLAAVIGDEVALQKGQESAVLKRILNIVGRDPINVHIKFKDSLPDTHLRCRFTFAMNDYPAFKDPDQALKRRIIIMPFNKTFTDSPDTSLKDQLAVEAAQGKLVTFALRGLRDLYGNGGFAIPAISQYHHQAFLEFVSPMVEFTRQCLTSDPAHGEPLDYLYDVWKWWITREGRHLCLKSTFARNLCTYMNTVHIRENEVGNGQSAVMGVRVNEWAKGGHSRGA
jgi:P4 family phage/plasmid primase-like protien